MPIKLQYYSNLYVSNSIPSKKLDRIKKKLEKNPLKSGVFLVAAARNGVDLLEIYSAGLLAQSYYKKEPPYVIGITKTYDEAVALVEQLVQDCLRERGDCSLKEYLSC